MAAGSGFSPRLLQSAVEEVRSSGVLDEARGVVEGYISAAFDTLEPFPTSPERDSLLAIARFVVERNY